jgi:hypothetical protein
VQRAFHCSRQILHDKAIKTPFRLCTVVPLHLSNSSHTGCPFGFVDTMRIRSAFITFVFLTAGAVSGNDKPIDWSKAPDRGLDGLRRCAKLAFTDGLPALGCSLNSVRYLFYQALENSAHTNNILVHLPNGPNHQCPRLD